MVDQPVAIVGYSAILPGGENVNQSWEMIKAGLDCISDIPPDRVDVSAYFHPNKNEPDKIYCTRGGFIPKFDFDPRMPPLPHASHATGQKASHAYPRGGYPQLSTKAGEFNFNMLQMEDTDTNQTLSLLKVKEALEDANINPSASVRKNIGCVLGNVGGSKASSPTASISRPLSYAILQLTE